MYIALTYIGTDFTPGEVLPEDLDKGFIERLLRMGAIREDARSPEPAAPAIVPTVTDEDNDDGEGITDTVEDAEEDTEEDAEEAEDNEPEAPEVDVTAALVQDDEAKKPNASRAKKGGKAK